MSPVPKNVVDKKLYEKIKHKIHEKLERQGKRWGIYASSELVRLYKSMGGRYTNNKEYIHSPKKLTGLDRWYKEYWINICKSSPPKKLVKCGRTRSGGSYPVCRPYYRITKETPTTYNEMNKKDIANICSKKNKNPLIKLSKFK
jgi:hypothetical protein